MKKVSKYLNKTFEFIIGLKNSRLIIFSFISIILVSTLLIGNTYSIFMSSNVDEDLNVYTTGNLDIKYSVSEDSVTLTNNVPTSIEESLSIKPYRVTVTNFGSVAYKFDLILNDTTASNPVDYQYLMVQVGKLEPVKFSDCTNGVIKENILILPDTSVDIDVRVWLSDTITNSEIGKNFYGKLSIDGIAVNTSVKEVDNDYLITKVIKYVKGVDLVTFSGDSDTNYFHSEDYNKKIKTVAFVDYIDTSNAVESWDMSKEQNESAIAWLNNNDTEGYYDLYIGSEELIAPTNMAYYFFGLTYVDNISFDNLDTTNVTDMSSMFGMLGGFSDTFALDLGDNFDTSNVTDMSGMFSVSGITTLDLGEKFDTSNVTNMGNMFQWTSNLSSLDLGDKFDTSNVTNMISMFDVTGGNSSSFTLNLGNKFNTSNVTNMRRMFNGTGKSNDNFELDLTSFTFEQVTEYSTFLGGTNLMETAFNTLHKVYVKNASDQAWILDKGFANVTSDNIIIRN